MNEDDRHLDLLALFHRIAGALTGLFACFPLLHVTFGIFAMFSFAPEEPMGFLFGFAMAAFGATMVILGWTLAVSMIIAGRRLRERRKRSYCVVVAALECMLMPYGTVLGVFTLIVLMRPSVIALFGEDEPMAG